MQTQKNANVHNMLSPMLTLPKTINVPTDRLKYPIRGTLKALFQQISKSASLMPFRNLLIPIHLGVMRGSADGDDILIAVIVQVCRH